ncbi:unnamed protein product, partial [Cyprideis torosa]
MLNLVQALMLEFLTRRNVDIEDDDFNDIKRRNSNDLYRDFFSKRGPVSQHFLPALAPPVETGRFWVQTPAVPLSHQSTKLISASTSEVQVMMLVFLGFFATAWAIVIATGIFLWYIRRSYLLGNIVNEEDLQKKNFEPSKRSA